MGQGDLGSATVELRNTSKSHFIVNSWWPQPIPHGTLVWQEAKMRKGPLRAVAHDGAISPMFKCPGKLRTIAGSWRSEDGSSSVSRTGSEGKNPPRAWRFRDGTDSIFICSPRSQDSWDCRGLSCRSCAT